MVRRGGRGGAVKPGEYERLFIGERLKQRFSLLTCSCEPLWAAVARHGSGDVCTPDTTHCHYQNIGRDVRAGKHFFKMFFSRLSFATPKYICELLVLRFLKAGVRGGLTTQFRFAHSRTG